MFVARLGELSQEFPAMSKLIVPFSAAHIRRTISTAIPGHKGPSYTSSLVAWPASPVPCTLFVISLFSGTRVLTL